MDPISGQEKRADLRFPMQAPITVFDYRTNEFFAAKTVNVSAHGLCLIIPVSLTCGEYIDVFFNHSKNPQSIIRKVRVVWTTNTITAPFQAGLHLDGERINPVSLVLAELSTKYPNS